MPVKCLVTVEEDNYALTLPTGRLSDLIQAIRNKCDQHALLTIEAGVIFEIFDNDFNTYVRMDENTTEIVNMDRIRMRRRPTIPHQNSLMMPVSSAVSATATAAHVSLPANNTANNLLTFPVTSTMPAITAAAHTTLSNQQILASSSPSANNSSSNSNSSTLTSGLGNSTQSNASAALASVNQTYLQNLLDTIAKTAAHSKMQSLVNNGQPFLKMEDMNGAVPLLVNSATGYNCNNADGSLDNHSINSGAVGGMNMAMNLSTADNGNTNGTSSSHSHNNGTSHLNGGGFTMNGHNNNGHSGVGFLSSFANLAAATAVTLPSTNGTGLSDFLDRDGDDGYSQDIEWPHSSVLALLDCCKQYRAQFAGLDVAFGFGPGLIGPSEQIWKLIAQDLHAQTQQSFDAAQCQKRFNKLRSTYINLLTYQNSDEDSKWPYKAQIKDLIDSASKQSICIGDVLTTKHIQPTNQGTRERVSPAYLQVISLVRNHMIEFSDPHEKKYQIWVRISEEMNDAGFKWSAKSCQNLFHRLRYTYLKLLKNCSDEELAQRRWPYFSFFADLDLRPFKTRRCVKGRRKRRQPAGGIENSQNLEDGTILLAAMQQANSNGVDDEEIDEELEDEEDFDDHEES